MEKFSCISSCLLGILLVVNGCGKSGEAPAGCDNQITLNQPFTARIGETWCLPDESWDITFGPYLEDSRCNVVNVDCVWAGRYVLATYIENDGAMRDTFFAVREWRDTLSAAGHTIILNKVYPEVRQSTDPLDASSYSFEIIVR
jgi:hypothetical protein